MRYHITWTPKYRRAVLHGLEALRIRELIRDICKDLQVKIIHGMIKKDCIQLQVEMPAELTLPNLMRHIKGKTGHIMLRESERFQSVFPKRHLWARGYYAIAVNKTI